MPKSTRTDISPIERIASHHWDHLNRQPVKPRPADPANDWGVWYCEAGSNVLFRVYVHNKPKCWKTRTGADTFARQSMAPDSPLARSLSAEAVYVGTPQNPRYSRVH